MSKYLKRSQKFLNFTSELKDMIMDLQEPKNNKVECPECIGTAQIFDGKENKECNYCKGKGKVNEDKYNYFIGRLDEEFTDA